ncbi:MAG: phenylacetate--CoA ligase family protein [Terriglobia bacterium]
MMAPLVRYLIFPLWLRRDHPHYPRYVREFQHTQFLTREEVKHLQWERLRKLLWHAYENCTFYRRRMQEAEIHPAAITRLEQVSALPVLTKSDIQDHAGELLARNYPAAARVRNQTGGSTGSPLQFYVDRERLDSRMASTTRHNLWAGLRPGDWCARLWGARLDQIVEQGWWDWCRNTLLYRLVELNTSCIRRDDWRTLVAALRRKRPRFLVTYAQSACLFARCVREAGIDDIRFESILTTAEVLLSEQRHLLEETFRARVYNRYGCREVSVIATECEFHRGMHVNAEALLVEVVPDSSIPGSVGKIVVTDLLNYSMPLIRYEIGDAGRWAPEQDCPCGRGLPLLADVQGRTTDFLVLPDGRWVSGPALTLVVADMADVRQVQFVQKAPAAVVLRVVPGRDYGSQTVAELRRRLGRYLDGHTALAIEEVEGIASEASGKYRFVINEVAAQQQNVSRGDKAHAAV